MASDESVRFPSLASLRAAHSALMKKYREGDSPERTAALEDFIRRGCATGALLDNEDDRQTAQSALDYWGTRLYRPGYEPPDATLHDFDPDLAPELPDDLCPYVGLDAFRENKQGVFFGRTKLINDLVRQLRTNRWLVVLGASGSGKSSVVRAGVLPALESGGLPGSQDWFYFPPMVPGSNPLVNLAKLTQATQVEESAAAYLTNPRYLADLVRERFSGTVVITIDQFEEIFTLCTDPAVRRAFVENLIALVNAPDAEHRVVITMRTDFEAQITLLPDFQPIFEMAVTRLAPMGVKELRDAIEAPANLIGLKFEAGVVDALLQDILGEEAALPLLQFTLLQLWERRERNRVTWEAYRKLGGGRQALATAADELYNRLIPEEQQTAKRILLRLVKPGEGREVTSSRILKSSLYIKAEASDRIDRVLDKLLKARLLRLTEGFEDEDTQIEIAHEALIRNWPRLVDWLDEERVRLRQRVRLTAAAEQWQRLGRDPSAVWRGLLLEEVRRYDDLSELENEFIRAGYSAEEAEAEAKRQAEAQAREAETARQIAEVERKRAEDQTKNAQRLRARNRFITALSVLALFAAIAAIVMGVQAYQSRDVAQAANTQSAVNLAKAMEQQATAEAASAEAQAQTKLAEAAYLAAERSAREALAEKLAAQARGPESDQFPQRSRLLTLAALDVTLSHGDPALASAESEVRHYATIPNGVPLIAHTQALNAARFSPDGQWLALASADATLTLWATDNAWESPIPLTGHATAVLALAFSVDSRWLVSGDAQGHTLAWDLSQSPPAPLELHGNGLFVSVIAFNADWLAVTGGDGQVRLWPAANLQPEPTFTLAAHTGPVRTLAFGADWLATGGEDALVKLWPLTAPDPTQPLTLSAHRGPVNSLAFSEPCVLSSTPPSTRATPEQRFRCLNWLVTASADSTAQLWDLASLTRPTTAALAPTAVLSSEETPIASVAFAPECAGCRRWLLTQFDDNTGGLWDLTSLVPPDTTVDFDLTTYTFAANCQDTTCQRYLAIANSNAFILHTLGVDRPFEASVARQSHEDVIRALAFSPDAHWLVSASADTTARVWETPNATSPTTPQILNPFVGVVSAVAFSPQNDWLAALSNDTTNLIWQLTLWPMADGLPATAQIFSGTQTIAQRLAFSPDGRWLAAGYADNSARLWDLTQTNPRSQGLAGHTGSILALAFSPDSQWVATGSRDGFIRLWDLGQPALAGTSDLTLTTGKWVWSLAFSPDNRYLAAGDQDGGIQLWDVQDPSAPLITLTGHTSFINALAFSPSGHYLASGGGDNLAQLWDLTQPLDQLATSNTALTGHTAPLTELAFSANERYLATASDDKTIQVWDLTTSPLTLQRLTAYQDSVTGLTFSPDCADPAQRCVLLTISADSKVRLWDLPSTAPVVMGGQSSRINALAISPDGRWLATGAATGPVLLWTVRLDDLRAGLCATIGRNFTTDEKNSYFSHDSLPAPCAQWP